MCKDDGVRCRLSSSRRMRCLLLVCLRQSGVCSSCDRDACLYRFEIKLLRPWHWVLREALSWSSRNRQVRHDTVNSMGLTDSTVPSTLGDSVGLIEKVGYLG